MTFDEAKANLIGTKPVTPDVLNKSIRAVLAEVDRLTGDNTALTQVIENYREGQAGLIELNHKADAQIAQAANEIEELRSKLTNSLPIAQPVTTNEQAAIEAARQGPGEALLLLTMGWEARQMDNQRQLQNMREG